MSTLCYIKDAFDIKRLAAMGVYEVIIQGESFSRFGKTGTSEINELAKSCKALGIRPLFEWDILMTEDVFQKTLLELKNIDLSQFAAIRVRDAGALNHVIDNYKKNKIHLILETGNNNLLAIKTWINISKNIARVVLSLEIQNEKLFQYCKELNVEVEYLVFGRILLSYSPRKLLSYRNINEESELSSLESPHAGFKVIENRHGTFMFHNRDLSLLDDVDRLLENITHLRIDNRFCEGELLKKIVNFIDSKKVDLLVEILEEVPMRVTKGLYLANKTEILFDKLKNEKRYDFENLIGEVVDLNKKKYIAVWVKKANVGISVGDKINLVTPEGKEKSLKICFLKDSNFNDVVSIEEGNIILVNHISGVSVKTMVYRT